MSKQFKALTLAIGAGLTLAGSAALADQTIGVQTVAATAAIATAKVNVRVIVPKIVVLKVGTATTGTIDSVDFTVATNPAVAGTPGNSLTYTGAVPPVLQITPATSAVTVAAWTNGSGATLVCSLGALAGATAFAAGATAAGVPGTTDITVASGGAGNLTHPGGAATTLTSCDGATSQAIAARSNLAGSFTYGSAFTVAALNTLAAGTYGNVVTYTATQP